MFVKRFRAELDQLPVYERGGQFDRRVEAANVPAWRAAFTAAVLLKHVAGYKLPRFKEFEWCYVTFLRRHGSFDGKFAWLFDVEGQPTPGFRHRLGGWYESGMAELYLYAVLAEALEDRLKLAAVVYDARVDWKLKADALVLYGGRVFKIDSYRQGQTSRQQVTARRAVIEERVKQNTSRSTGKGIEDVDRWEELHVRRDEQDHELVRGLPLFSRSALDDLLRQLYDRIGVDEGRRVWITEMLATRP